MSQEINELDGIDPALTREQAAGLARHLERSGIQFLPAVDQQAAASLAAQMTTVGPVQDVATQSGGEQRQSGTAAAPDRGPDPVTAPLSDQSSAQPTAQSTAPIMATESAPAQAATPSDFQLDGSAAAGDQPYPGTSLPIQQREDVLQNWSQQVAACERCEVLAKCRSQTVFGEGSAQPRIVFFGEGPGRDEDLSGRPFVGKAGQLLTKMIEACQFSREDVYIMNTVKCRPPNNRNPDPTEVENCREFFEAQLQVLRPEYIVCLGLVSAQALLKNKLSVGRMRGKFHNHFESKVVVTYHPSYLLRNPAAKKAAWEDLQMMLRDANLL